MRKWLFTQVGDVGHWKMLPMEVVSLTELKMLLHNALGHLV